MWKFVLDLRYGTITIFILFQSAKYKTMIDSNCGKKLAYNYIADN